MGINHRPVIVGHPLHGQHLEYLRNGIEGRHQLSGGLLQPVDFGHHIRVGELPHGAVPAVLQVIVGVVAPALQGFRVVHVARKHVRIEILRELERPVLALAEIVIEIAPPCWIMPRRYPKPLLSASSSPSVMPERSSFMSRKLPVHAPKSSAQSPAKRYVCRHFMLKIPV